MFGNRPPCVDLVDVRNDLRWSVEHSTIERDRNVVIGGRTGVTEELLHRPRTNRRCSHNHTILDTEQRQRANHRWTKPSGRADGRLTYRRPVCGASVRIWCVREIWIERRKWPASPHYGHVGWVLGEDHHGLWLELRVGSPVHRGEELLLHGTTGGLMLVPPSDDWLAWFPEFGDFELYVDIVSGTERSETAVTTVDLDLDVIRRRDGTIELLDVDEFELHQVELAYPPELIDHAERAAQRVLAAVTGGEEPFAGSAAKGWMKKCHG